MIGYQEAQCWLSPKFIWQKMISNSLFVVLVKLFKVDDDISHMFAPIQGGDIGDEIIFIYRHIYHELAYHTYHSNHRKALSINRFAMLNNRWAYNISDSNTVADVHREVRIWLAKLSWWRHQMEKFSALLAICVGNSPVTGEFPAQRPVTRSFDIFFDLT